MTTPDSTANTPSSKIVPGPLQDLIPLLDWKEGKNAQNKSTGNTILHVIIESLQQGKMTAEEAVPLVQSYCSKGGVNPNIRNNVGDTPMHILMQSTSLAKKTNALGEEGHKTAERVATAKQKILQELIDQGADLTIKNNKGQSVVYRVTPESGRAYPTLPLIPALHQIQQSLHSYQSQGQHRSTAPRSRVNKRPQMTQKTR